MLTITDNAVEKIRDILAEENNPKIKLNESEPLYIIEFGAGIYYY